MGANLTPPIRPFRKADASSRYLSKDLAIAYPMLDGDSTLRNYGTWGSLADLSTTNVTFSKLDGLTVANFNSSATAFRTGLSLTVPDTWSFAYWVKIDAAPTIEELNVFSLHGPSEPHARAWIDQQGLWSWQKHATADSYSILPISDFPTSNLMLVVSVFGNDLPPAQLRTNERFTTPPTQPLSYTAFNYGLGAKATAISSIYLGNNFGGGDPLNGSLGPFYFWSRAISDSEVWQLWQDPYAPFRRSTEQIVVPSTVLSQSSFSLEGIGKPTDKKPLFQDDDALTIQVNDYIQYATPPPDTIPDSNSGLLPYVNIIVSDSYNYQSYPEDSIDEGASGTPAVLEITVNDSVSFVTPPTDLVNAVAPFSLITVTINDDIAYVANPTDFYDDGNSSTITNETINVSDTYGYQDVPVETVTSP